MSCRSASFKVSLSLILSSLLLSLLSCDLEIERDKKLKITELSAVALSNSSILLRWKEVEQAIAYTLVEKKTNSEVYHRIHEETSNTNPTTIRYTTPSHDAGVSQTIIKGLLPNTTYDFQITVLTNVEGYANSEPALISSATNP